MKTVVLDAASLGADLDLNPFMELPDAEIWDHSDPSDVIERIKDARVIICNRIDLNAQVLKQAEKLEMIALTATGFNTVDMDYCRAGGISVANVKFYSTESVAQHCFSMLFYLLEQTRYYDDYVRSKSFIQDKRFAELSRPWFELKGKTWGIIGMGEIGRRVAEIATAFGCRPVYTSISGIKREESCPEVPLDTLLCSSDIISIHSPLTDKTRGLIGRDELDKMKKSCFFLNLGRGAIVDEKALAQVISEKGIAGAGLDVLTEEPPSVDNPLLNLLGERLLITPHNAWGSLESRSRLIREVAENVKAYLRGEARNLIP